MYVPKNEILFYLTCVWKLDMVYIYIHTLTLYELITKIRATLATLAPNKMFLETWGLEYFKAKRKIFRFTYHLT